LIALEVLTICGGSLLKERLSQKWREKTGYMGNPSAGMDLLFVRWVGSVGAES